MSIAMQQYTQQLINVHVFYCCHFHISHLLFFFNYTGRIRPSPNNIRTQRSRRTGRRTGFRLHETLGKKLGQVRKLKKKKFKNFLLSAIIIATQRYNQKVGVFYSLHSKLSRLVCSLLYRYCRDDRCVGDNGREGWYPYLSEEVVSLLQSMPIEHVRHTHLAF